MHKLKGKMSDKVLGRNLASQGSLESQHTLVLVTRWRATSVSACRHLETAHHLWRDLDGMA
jgi:hypothetical protein